MSDSVSQINFLKGKTVFGSKELDCIVNEKFIRYIARKNSACFYICSRMDGCSEETMIKICKYDLQDEWNKINKLFN